jgi:hypothetical protein
MTKLQGSTVNYSKGSTGVTGSNGTANSLTKLFALVVPNQRTLKLDEETIIAIKDRGATESAAGSLVEIRVTPSDGFGTKIVAQTTYDMIKMDRTALVQFKPFKGSNAMALGPSVSLEVWIKSDQTVYGAVAASTDFYLEAKM